MSEYCKIVQNSQITFVPNRARGDYYMMQSDEIRKSCNLLFFPRPKTSQPFTFRPYATVRYCVYCARVV